VPPVPVIRPAAPAIELLPAAGVDDTAPVAPSEIDSIPPRSDVLPQAVAIPAASNVHANHPVPLRNVDTPRSKALSTAIGNSFCKSKAAVARMFAAKRGSKAGADEGRA
jgi:hypothetical protein